MEEGIGGMFLDRMKLASNPMTVGDQIIVYEKLPLRIQFQFPEGKVLGKHYLLVEKDAVSGGPFGIIRGGAGQCAPFPVPLLPQGHLINSFLFQLFPPALIKGNSWVDYIIFGSSTILTEFTL